MNDDLTGFPRRRTIISYLAGIGVEVLLAASLAGIAVLLVVGSSLLLR
jgi:hypothetical protein